MIISYSQELRWLIYHNKLECIKSMVLLNLLNSHEYLVWSLRKNLEIFRI